MKKTKKVFLPKWQRYWIVPFMVLIWLLVTYLEFFGDETGELGVFGYLVMSLILLGTVVMLWFMTGGKLPAYVIEEDDEQE